MIFDGKPTVIGHRGFGKGAEENTIASCRAAVDGGLGWVEVDVQRTADDDLVIRHDPTMPVAEPPDEPEGEWPGDTAPEPDERFVIETRAEDSGLPRLVEVFAALPTDIAVDVDVKTVLEDATAPPARRTGALLVPLLAAEARRRRLFVSSFDPALLLHIREHLPELPVGLLTWLGFPVWHAVTAAVGLGMDAVGLHTASLDGAPAPVRRCVDTAHTAGLEVLAWCPPAEDARRYAAAGVDALIVNDPPEVLAALGTRPPDADRGSAD